MQPLISWVLEHAWWLGVLFVLACYQIMFLIAAVFGEKKWDVIYTWRYTAINATYQTREEYPTLEECREAVIAVQSNGTTLVSAVAISNDGDYTELYP
jgi:hypothetical protein